MPSGREFACSERVVGRLACGNDLFNLRHHHSAACVCSATGPTAHCERTREEIRVAESVRDTDRSTKMMVIGVKANMRAGECVDAQTVEENQKVAKDRPGATGLVAS